MSRQSEQREPPPIFKSMGGGRTSLITLLEKAKDGIEGKTGTAIHL